MYCQMMTGSIFFARFYFTFTYFAMNDSSERLPGVPVVPAVLDKKPEGNEPVLPDGVREEIADALRWTEVDRDSDPFFQL